MSIIARIYTPSNWYWAVAGNTVRVFSSASGTYVPVADTTYVSWLLNGPPTIIDSEASLTAVLAVSVPGLTPNYS